MYLDDDFISIIIYIRVVKLYFAFKRCKTKFFVLFVKFYNIFTSTGGIENVQSSRLTKIDH